MGQCEVPVSRLHPYACVYNIYICIVRVYARDLLHTQFVHIMIQYTRPVHWGGQGVQKNPPF